MGTLIRPRLTKIIISKTKIMISPKFVILITSGFELIYHIDTQDRGGNEPVGYTV